MTTIADIISMLATKPSSSTVDSFSEGHLTLLVQQKLAQELNVLQIDGAQWLSPVTVKILNTPQVVEALAASKQCHHRGPIARLVVPEDIDDLSEGGVLKFRQQGLNRPTRYVGRAIGSAAAETDTPDRSQLWAIAPWERRLYYVFDVEYAFNRVPLIREAKDRDAFLDRYDLDIDFYDWLL
jgi:hypothetical protein